MSPLVRGRIIAETESAGRAKARLDVLLWLPEFSRQDFLSLDLIEILRTYLRSINPTPCQIKLWIPADLVDVRNVLEAVDIEFTTLVKLNETPQVVAALGPTAPQELKEIAATALSVDADLVVIGNSDWYPYAIDFEKLNMLLTDSNVLKRQCEIFVRGYDVPWAFDYMAWHAPWNGFYTVSELRTFEAGLNFLERAHKRQLDKDTQEAGRTLVHNRLPNLCFTRDRLLFYDLQQAVSRRLSLERQEFVFEAGYYLNFYYLLLHGGFDHLALVVNGALSLGLAPKSVGATYGKFLTALLNRAPEIHALFTDPRLLDFLDRISSLRHFAAHRGSIAPGKIYEKLDPEPTAADLDAEIAKRGLDKFLGRVPPGPVHDAFRATLRHKMVLSMSKLLSEGVVFLELRGKWHYIRPMTDILWNFERFHVFMVAVLNALSARV